MPADLVDDAPEITVGDAYEVGVWADQSLFTPLGVAFHVPRAIAFDDTNGAYVAAQGRIWYLEDRGSECNAAQKPPCNYTVPDGKADPNPFLVIDDASSTIGQGSFAGLLYFQGNLYVTRGVDDAGGPPSFVRNEVLMFSDRDGDGIVDDADDDGALEEDDVIVSTDSTDFHSMSGMVPTPDGQRILVSKGSYGNVVLGPFGPDPCVSPQTCNAALLAFDLDGSNVTVYAQGLRNTVEPQFGVDGQLFGVDNGRNMPGLDPPEEINRIEEGGQYGFPNFAAGSPQPPGATPIGTLPPHEAPAGSAAYPYPELIQFPGEHDQYFQALYGPFAAALANPFGQSVVRLNVSKVGPDTYVANPEQPPDLVTGVTNAFAYGFEHPVDVATNRHGDLFVVDLGDDGYPPFDDTGKIYRITFRDLAIDAPALIVDQSFQIVLRGSPFAYFALFVGLDPDPNFALDYGPGGRNGTSVLDAPIQVKSGILKASGERTLTVKISPPATGLLGHQLRLQMYRVDYDPIKQTFPPGDLFIGKAVTREILP